jgi:hypothetical protein
MALYYPPITPRSPIFANSNYAIPNTPVSAGGTGTITEEFLATNYLQFPGAQGVENFGFKELQLTSTNLGETATLYINPATGQDVVLESTQSNGSLTIQTSATTNNTMVLSPSTGLTFGDGTTQITAYNDINTVQTDQNNTFLSPYINTFQGSNSTLPSTGPLQISNVSTSEYASFYVDPSPTYDLTLYTAQTGNTAGLTVRNPNYSFSVNPTVGNVASFVNPISSTYSISGQSFGVNTTGSEAYTIYSNTTPSNYGLVIANTTGNNGSLTLSNNGGTLTTITSTSTGLNIADPLSVDGTLTLGSSSVNATINTASANGITTLSNNNVSGGFTFNVNGGPISTICNMLGTGFYIYNTLDMGDNNIVGLNKLGVTTGQTLSIVDGVTNLMTFSTVGMNIYEDLGMNGYNIIGIDSLAGNGVNNIGFTSPINMNDNNINGINGLSVTTGQTLSIIDGTTNIMTFNTSGINSYESITMNGVNLIMGANNITGIGTISGSGLSDISITSGLNFTTAGGINCGGGSIINCNTITDTSGNLVNTTTPTNNNVTNAIATTGYVNSFATTVINPISSITGATFNPTNGYVYTNSNYVSVLIKGLVVYCNTNTPYLTIFFNNNLYSPISRIEVTLDATGYFANSSNGVLQAFTPNSIDTSFNSISIRANSSLSSGQTYVTSLQFNFYF